jgi:hypothetical protein
MVCNSVTGRKLEGGLYTGEFERCMKEGSRGEYLSPRELCEGNLVGGLLYWGTRSTGVLISP